MRRITQAIAAGGLVLFLIGTLLPFLNLGANGKGPSLWEATTTEDVLLVLVALAGITVLVLGVILDHRWSAAVGAGAAAFIAGQLTPTEAQTLDGFDFGFWLMVLAAYGTLALALLAAVWPEPAGGAVGAGPPPATARPAPPPPPAETPTTVAPALPTEPGWYPDPQGGGGLRLWSGSRWTDETRGG